MATQTEIDNLSALSGKPLIDSLDKYTRELQDELTTLSNTLNRIYDLIEFMTYWDGGKFVNIKPQLKTRQRILQPKKK